MSRLIILLASFSTLFYLASGDGFFTIVGSKVIRPDTEYHLSIVSQGYEKPTLFRVSINGTEDNGRVFIQSRDVTLLNDQSQMLGFDLKNLKLGDYKLDVKSIDGEHFEESIDLDINTKKYSVFIQTDKSIYKPADKVLFRVLILDASTKPFPASDIKVYITDGGQNRVKQYSNVRLIKGVYQNEMLLSDSPVMGNWMIHVKVNDDDEITKTFEVAEYVLPKYEVIVESNPYVTFKDGKIRATVKAKYTYGKSVKGQATISCYPVLWLGAVQPFIQDNIVRKVVQVDGKGSVEFDIREELKIEGDYERYVNIEAIFEEELTGRRQNGSTQITIHKFKYNMELVKESETYKPGLPFNLLVKVKYHDGAPLIDKLNPVKIYVQYTWNEENETSTDYYLDDHGMADVKIIIPANTAYLSIKAKYLDSDFFLGHITQAKSHSNQYIKAKLVTDKPTINQEVSVDVIATEKIKQVTYQVLGRGDVIVSRSVPTPEGKNVNFKFLATFAMIPNAYLIVYYIRSDGEIISDRLKVEFRDELQNFIDVELSANQTEPGETLNIIVTTKPNSYVGLLGVDQRVLFLKTGNDLEKSEVFSELDKYNEKTRWQRRWYSDYSSYSDFETSGAVVITNAKEEIPRLNDGPISRRMGFFDDDVLDIKLDSNDELFQQNSHGKSFEGSITNQEFRKVFPETWIFDGDSNLGYEGRTTLSKKVPDTITSWIITGFSVDPINGLGLTKQPTKLNVFKPFFVSTNLPYSIKRGEAVAIPIIVFNYMDKDHKTEVTLFNNEGEFEFPEVDEEDNKVIRQKREVETQRKKNIIAKMQSGTLVSFMIRPLKVGQITIKVVATSAIAGDAVERQLVVEAEGVTQYMNKAVFIDLRNKPDFKSNLSITVPANAVPDSTKVEVSAIGDILGPSIENLDKLIKLPYGCGEQNMLNFVPNIVVLDYLTKLGKLTTDIELKSKKYMETGYQRELSYKHDDGSYSAFGKSDTSGSTWLTAFVAKYFRQASKYIMIQEEIINEALNFLSNVQAQDGSFNEVGHVSHKDMQGGAAKGIALTAYTLITFLENQTFLPKYQNTINKALDFIVRNFEALEDTYSLAIASYALQLAKHSSKDAFLSKLDRKSENKNGQKYWQKPIPVTETKSPWNEQPNSVNVEMSAYALQTFVEAGLESDAVPTLKWLISQRNENGGFQSTQDTIVGLQALAKLATKIYIPNSRINIQLQYNNASAANLNINEENSLVLQKYELPTNVKDIEVIAKGRGFGMLQLSYKFNMNVTGVWPRFVLDPQVNRLSTKDFLHLTVCTSFVPDSVVEKSNMAVMEVFLPSGYTFDSETVPFLRSSAKVKKVETKEGDTVVIVYFDDMDKQEICPVFKAFRTHKVANQKPAPVIIYDYYDNTRRATQFYKAKTADLCDICDEDDCGETCKVKAQKRVSTRSESQFDEDQERSEKGQSNKLSFSITIMTILIITKIFHLI